MPVGPDGWFDAAKPIAVEGGLRARSRRGSIGEQWWSRRFIDILEQICDPGRLARGRSYARRGQVLSLEVTPGVVRASVQGSRPRPYAVTVAVAVFAPAVWARIERAVAARAVYRASLLAGEMPREIEQVFADAGHPLFPAAGGLDLRCSCPDAGVPCKHLSAVLYLLAEEFDADPFLVLAWRGRGRTELLDAVRGAAAPETGRQPPAEAPPPDRPRDFYTPAISLNRLRPRPDRLDAPPDLLLRAVEPPKLRVRHLPLLDILRSAYRRLGD